MNWALGGTYEVMWTKTDKGWRVDDPNKKQSQGTQTHNASGPVSKSQPTGGLSKDEKVVAAFTIAASAFAGKVTDVEHLRNLARNVYDVMFPVKKAPAPAAPAPAPAAPAYVPPPAPAPEPVPTPAPNLPVDFDSAEFEEDEDNPF
jgi:hypothetical protein